MEIIGIEDNHPLSNDDLQWHIECTNEYGNIGISETRNLDTNSNDYPGGGGGGGGGSIPILLNPKKVDLFYPEIWYRNTNITLIAKVYSLQDKVYIPKNTSLYFNISGITLINITYDHINQTIFKFNVDKGAKLGNQTIKLIFDDERTIAHDITIIIKEKEINLKEKPEDPNLKYFNWVIYGIGLLIFLIIIIFAIMTDKSRKKKA